ncbi:PKD domain-containing protein, partial [Acinetobacter baumannii]
LFFLLLSLSACDPWNLEPRSFPTCDAPAATIATTVDRLNVQFSLANQTGTADAIAWNFGDGTSSTVFTINHGYAQRG